MPWLRDPNPKGTKPKPETLDQITNPKGTEGLAKARRRSLGFRGLGFMVQRFRVRAWV